MAVQYTQALYGYAPNDVCHIVHDKDIICLPPTYDVTFPSSARPVNNEDSATSSRSIARIAKTEYAH